MSFPVWGLRACPRKKINFALKLCNSEQVLVLLSYITAESGDYPSHKSGDLSPCSDAYGFDSRQQCENTQASGPQVERAIGCLGGGLRSPSASILAVIVFDRLLS